MDRATKLISYLFLILILSGGLGSSAFAEMRIAIVDLQKALVSVKEGANAKSKLQKEVEAKQAALKKKEAKIKKDVENFQKQSGVLSAKVKQEKQAKLQQRIMGFQQEAAKMQASLQNREKELTEPILKKLKKVISSLSKKNKYSLVLERNESGILFSNNVKDITSEVISTYNKSN